jgi:hypothetical protein
MPTIGSRARRATALALGLTLVVAASASALEWRPVSTISGSGVAFSTVKGTAVTGNRTVHVIYSERVQHGFVAKYRRSMDGGLTWARPVRLSHSGPQNANALALDSTEPTILDTIVTEFDEQGHFVLWYRRSLDNGSSWEDPIRLTRRLGDAGDADVARDGNRVAVVYTNGETGDILVRVSNDGGLTFGAAVKVGITTYRPYRPRSDSFDGFAAIEASNGVINAAWHRTRARISSRDSTDGTTWTPRQEITPLSAGLPISMTADGNRIFVGYTQLNFGNTRAALRRSTDNGATWELNQRPGPRDSLRPTLAFRDGRLWFAYTQFTNRHGFTVDLRFSDTRGRTFAAPDRVSRPVDEPFAVAEGVGALASDKAAVIYERQTARRSFLLARRTE